MEPGALEWHISANFWPPLSPELVSSAREAIDAVQAGDPERSIELPNGQTVTASQMLEDVRLSEFLEDPEGMTE